MNLVEAGHMRKVEVLQEKTYAKSLAKGLLAGLIGGLVATAAKSFAERIYPPRTHGEPEPPELLTEKIAGHELVGADKKSAEEAIHWGFGAMTGAAYGALAEYYPAATVREGAGFGMALNSLTHGTALPAMGLSAEPEEQSMREKTSEMATHLVFGMVTETVRRFVRKILG
jgi:putative membrane protein